MTTWVTVRAFTNVSDAQLAGSALEAAGLDTRLADEHLVSMQWMYSNAVGGVKVQVPADQHDEAALILEERATVDDPAAMIDPGDACRACGSTDVEAVLRAWQPSVMVLLVTGAPLLPLRRERRCKGCGASLDEQAESRR